MNSVSAQSFALFQADILSNKQASPLDQAFSPGALEIIQTLFQGSINSDHWIFEDAEPDDEAAILFSEKISGSNLRIIAEPHGKREEVYERTEKLLRLMDVEHPSEILLTGNGHSETVSRLKKELETIKDNSLLIQVIGPCPTLEALIKEAPVLLSRKIKRIVAMGGFAYRECEHGKYHGTKVYYTTHNLSANIQAAQTLFTFAESYRVPTYIIATDNLRLSRSLNSFLASGIQKCNTKATNFLVGEIECWNRIFFQSESDNKEKASSLAQRKIKSLSVDMTPADVISTAFNLSFEQLSVQSRGFSKIVITEEPRYEKQGDSSSSFKPFKRHRAVTLEVNSDSVIRYVDQFKIQGTNLDTTQSFQKITECFLGLIQQNPNIRSKHMSGSIPSISSQIAILPTPSLSSASSSSSLSLASLSLPSVPSSASTPAASSAPSVSAISTPAAVALPKEISIATLVSNSLQMNVKEAQAASKEEISNAVKEKDVFKLKQLLNQSIAAEYAAGKFNIGLRDQFAKGFAELQRHYNKEADKIKNGVDAYEKLTPQKREELYLFATESRGGETWRTYGKIIFEVPVNDKDYPSKAMQIAKNKWQYRPNDLVLGTNHLLSQLSNEKSLSLNVTEPLFLTERTEFLATLLESTLKQMAELSENLETVLKSNNLSKQGMSTVIFERGMIGSGKTTFLKNVLGIDESQTCSSDALKMKLGGYTAHHEACALSDKIFQKLFKNSIDIRTNVRKRDVETLTKPKRENVQHVIFDLYLSHKMVQERINKQVLAGSRRKPNVREIEEGFSDSVKNRLPIIEAALKNSKLVWRLYNNEGPTPVLAAEASNQVLKIYDKETFDASTTLQQAKQED